MSIATTTTNSYLRVIRAPLDTVLALVPDNVSGVTSARLAIDRADAAVRQTLGMILRDRALVQDADRRRAAAGERTRAKDLREIGDRQAQGADARLEQREDRATSKRDYADKRAADKRREASRTRTRKVDAAAAAQRKRTAAKRKATARRDESLERNESKARLSSLETKSEALEDRGKALAAADDARRLGRAAGRVKAQRKSN